MNIARWSLLVVLIGLGAVRASGYLVYAAASLPSPLETFHLEAKMVLLAYRAELGETLYPAWRDYPHVTNFYGPVYFGSVGLIGRILGADIPGLFQIGRALSFGSGLLTSLIVGVVAARRYGGISGVAGGLVSLGSAPMLGFSVMVRPDLMAELLGVAGFFLAFDRSPVPRLVGAAALVLAVLTKQTTGIFLIAASLGWALEGSWKRGFLLGLGVLTTLVAVIWTGTSFFEPNFAGSLTGESKTPWDLGTLARTLKRACMLSPDILYFPALGLVLWITGATGKRDGRMMSLSALLLATSVGLSAKRGADLNYYLSLRVVEALAVGALWRAWSISTNPRRSAALASAALVGCLAMVPGTEHMLQQARLEQGKARFLGGPDGVELRSYFRSICSMAANPKVHLLTDSGLFELYQGGRAAFGDPWLFRTMTDTGQIKPTLMRDRIDSSYYDLIVTTAEIDHLSYRRYEFGLPNSLAERVGARYIRVDYQKGLFLYRRRPEVKPELGLDHSTTGQSRP